MSRTVQSLLVVFTDTVARFGIVDKGKVERAMNVGVGLSKSNPMTEGVQNLSICIVGGVSQRAK